MKWTEDYFINVSRPPLNSILLIPAFGGELAYV